MARGISGFVVGLLQLVPAPDPRRYPSRRHCHRLALVARRAEVVSVGLESRGRQELVLGS